MSFRVPSRSVSVAILLVVVTSALVAGCTSVQETPTPQSGEPTSNTGSRSQTSQWTVTITRIVDGDTVEFRYANGTTDTGRLLGVDTPEVHTENDPSEFEGVPDDASGERCLRDWGHKASEFARAELVDERVTITLDANEGPRGYYGRLLIYIRESDGTRFNYQLVKQGYARVYDSEFTKRDRFYAAEANAQQHDVGLWECTNGGRSADGKGNTDGTVTTDESTTRVATDGGTSGLSVARIHADADGNDHENLNDEYVVLKNAADETLDLSGWTVSDDGGHTYRVPSGVTLAGGETLTLYTGSGSDSASELHWNADAAVWNNGGDTVVVRDATGTVVLRRKYEG
ncbi:lamin tail domain-containing protein [Haladaptatus sp. T7]|uniref:lamin tail domain-containing protein n=1 Tax=Haladaptatus sp. T7 TaxID=2029368 RepID=UPI002232978C|nr:lamin tail domain-containing protein [Haladaptatus sp. T7]